MKNVLYNKGGHVAHIAFPINTKDSWDAFVIAVNVAREHSGQIDKFYADLDGGRSRILGVYQSGAVLEFGTPAQEDEENAERDAIRRERDDLRNKIAEYLRFEPRKGGHAQARRKLAEAIQENQP